MSMREEQLDQRPVGRLLSDLASQMNALLRAELDLLRVEMRRNVESVNGALMSLVIGAGLLIAALVALVQAAIAGLVAAEMSVWLAATLVGVAFAIVGAIVLKAAVNKLSPSELTPDRTVRQMKKNTDLIKETAR